MSSLSQVTSATRKLLEYIGIIVGSILLLVIVFNAGKALKEFFSPTPPPPPTVSFGKVPQILFPISPIQTQLTFTVNTLTGSLPQLPDRATVYKMAAPAPNLLGLDKAKTIAAAAGFKTNPIALSESSYKWTTTDPLAKTFTMNTQTLDFSLSSPYMTNQIVQNAQFLPNETDAVKLSQQFFDGILALPTTIDTSKTKTTLLSIQNGQLRPASSLSDAKIIRVDYFMKSVEKLPLYTINPSQSLLYTLVASTDNSSPQIVEAQYVHKAISDQKATYPIKTASQALDDLKNGKGYIAAFSGSGTTVSITDVSLGYFLDTTSQDYLEPLIVLQGDQGFVAYVAALTDTWTQK